MAYRVYEVQRHYLRTFLPDKPRERYPVSSNASFPGFAGVASAVGRFALIWLIIYIQSRGHPVVFDPGGKHGEFGKRLLPMYLDITKFVLGLAAGSIVLLVGFLNFNQSNGRSLSHSHRRCF